MTILGYISSIAAAAFYTLRFSTIKDLKISNLSKNELNFYTRLFSLPFILFLILLTGVSVTSFKPGFYPWMLATILIHALYNIYMVRIFQKYDFSFVMTLEPIKIPLSFVLGYLFLGEILQPNQFIGMLIIFLALSTLVLFDKKIKLKALPLWEVTFFYLFTAFLGLINKKVILLSSTLSFTLWSVVGLILVHFLLSLGRPNFYKLETKATNKALVCLGFLSAVSFAAVNYGLEVLPIAIVSTLVTTKMFMSLWLSHKKYKEQNIKLKVLVSVIAFIGVIILFFA